MKRFSFEFKKLFSGKTPWILCFALLLNLFIYYVYLIPSIPSEDSKKITLYWNHALEAYGDDLAAQLEFLNTQVSDIALLKSYLTVPEYMFPEEIRYVKEKFKDTKYTDIQVLNQTIDVLYNLAAQRQAVIDYDVFIANLNERAQDMLKFSIFSEENSFSKRNIEKTVRDFSRVSDVDVKPADDTPIRYIQDFYLTDILLLLIICLLSFQLFGQDAEKGMLELIRSAPGGGLHLRWSQLSAVTLTAAGISIVFYLSNIIQTQLWVGIDLSVTMQSLSRFRNMAYPWTTGIYIVLFLIGKTWGIVFTALFCQFLAILFKGKKLSWLLFGLTIAVSFLLWFFIPDHPAAKFLRYLNPVGLLDQGQILGNYQNLNLFSYPVSLLNAAVIFSVVLGAAFMMMILFLPGLNVRLARSRSSAKKFKSRPGRPFAYELYKIMVNQKAWLIMCALIVISVASFDISSQYVSAQDFYYQQYISQWQGEFSDDIPTHIQQFMNETPGLSDGEFEALGRILERTQALSALKQQHTSKHPLGLVNDYPLNQFFMDSSTEITNWLIIILALILSLCTLYHMDFKNNMTQLQKSMPLKHKIFWNKSAAAAGLGFVYTMIIWSADLIAYFIRYGISNTHYAIWSYQPFKSLPFSISIFEGMIITILLRCITGIALGLIIALIAQCIPSPSQNILISGLILALPLCLSYIAHMGYSNGLVAFIQRALKPILKFSDLITAPQCTLIHMPPAALAAVAAVPVLALILGKILWNRK